MRRWAPTPPGSLSRYPGWPRSSSPCVPRLAGEIVQKFVYYRLNLAVVGDVSAHVEASTALRDFVREANRGRHLWFVGTAEEFAERLAPRAVADPA